MIELNDQGIPVSQLKLGMFVSRLDVPWEKTSFPIQGLMIRSLEDIEKLACYSQRVFVDIEKSRPDLHLNNPLFRNPTRNKKQQIRKIPKPQKINANWKKKHCVENYAIESSIKREMYRSIDIFDKLEKQITHLCEDLIHAKKSDIDALVESTSQVVDSVIRNPDALAWLCRIRDTRKPIYMHTIRMASWAGIVGRQLGLNRFALSHLCTSLLMSGIGKSQVSEQALAGYCATKTSHDYQKHLHETLYQLREMRYHSDEVYNTIENYCERINGSGFPARKEGNQIPFLSQIAGLIETYELLINPYDESRAISPANAVVFLNRYKGISFELTLVEEFIKAIGLYPTGTLVELSDGQKGVVFSQNYEKRLRASVIPIISGKGYVVEKYRVLDLSYTDRREAEDNQVYIRKGVPSSNIPRGLLEQAHEWMFGKNKTMKGFLKSIF